MVKGFICVHVGAGFHSEKYEKLYLQLCKTACLKGMEVIRSGGTALDGAVSATVFLEDSPMTNAGFGSNLTYEGTVECDACAMVSPGRRFGAVGAVPGVQNPIKVAAELIHQQKVPLSLGRIPPCFLAGDGARSWAESKGLKIVHPDSLISEKAQRQHTKYKRRALSGGDDANLVHKGRLDTVGVVCVDSTGQVAATSSSGGILLKHPGRIGQAGVFGCGCWADGTVGVTVSGGGEDLIRSSLAQAAAEALKSSPAPGIGICEAVDSFLSIPNLCPSPQRLCGLLAVFADEFEESGCGEFVYAHNTDSMGIGFMSASQKHPKSVMSRKRKNDRLKLQAMKWS